MNNLIQKPKFDANYVNKLSEPFIAVLHAIPIYVWLGLVAGIFVYFALHMWWFYYRKI
jgi:hypothetical protein